MNEGGQRNVPLPSFVCYECRPGSVDQELLALLAALHDVDAAGQLLRGGCGAFGHEASVHRVDGPLPGGQGDAALYGLGTCCLGRQVL